MTRPFALALLVPALLLAGGAQAGGKPRAGFPVEVLSIPTDAVGIDSLGDPIGVILDRQEGLPPNATDSRFFTIPDGQHLVLDHVGAFATFDSNLPAGARFPLFLSGGGVQMPIGFGEVIGREIHFAIPTSLVLRSGFNLAILGSFGGAELQFVRYSFSGRLVPVE